jgi:hypothetical protein
LWKLKVNADKTKVMVFGNGRLPQNLSFSYDNLNLEIVKKEGFLLFCVMPIITVSNNLLARFIKSMWPLVIGSKEPG